MRPRFKTPATCIDPCTKRHILILRRMRMPHAVAECSSLFQQQTTLHDVCPACCKSWPELSCSSTKSIGFPIWTDSMQEAQVWAVWLHASQSSCILQIWRAVRCLIVSFPVIINIHLPILYSSQWLTPRQSSYSLHLPLTALWFATSPHSCNAHQSSRYKPNTRSLSS